MYTKPKLAIPLLAALLIFAGCGADGSSFEGDSPDDGEFGDAGTGGSGDAANNDQPPEEEEEEFEFTTPTVLGEDVYVANETLDSVAIIDSTDFNVSTREVGFRPIATAGPDEDVTEPAEDARVFVLNQGSRSVSLLDPNSDQAENVRVMARANAIEADPSGTNAVVWYDPSEAESGEPAGDLSSVTVIADGESYEVAVGFRVRSVHFNEDGSRALVLSDDGVSQIDLDQIDDDGVAAPRPVVPDQVHPEERSDLEVLVSPDARFAVARSINFAGLVLLDVDEDELTVLDLPETPTDLDLVDRDELSILTMLPQSDRAMLATIPEGFEAAADEDTGEELPDGVDGVEVFDIDVGSLGAASITEDGQIALIYSTVDDEQSAVLLDLAGGEQARLTFEKGVRGATSDREGDSFLVYHSKAEGDPPANTGPDSPEFIEHSWAVSVVDIEAAHERLVLTDHEPGQATLWSGDDASDPRVFLIYELPDDDLEPTHRDLITINLNNFRTDTHRLASAPETLGPIRTTGYVYVSQFHPRGRITFFDAGSLEPQTITGYQLNAGID